MIPRWIWVAVATRRRRVASPDVPHDVLGTRPQLLEAIRARTARQAADFDAIDAKAAALLAAVAAVIAVTIVLTAGLWAVGAITITAAALGLLITALHPRDFAGLEPEEIRRLSDLSAAEQLDQLINAEVDAFNANKGPKQLKLNLVTYAQWAIVAALVTILAGGIAGGPGGGERDGKGRQPAGATAPAATETAD